MSKLNEMEFLRRLLEGYHTLLSTNRISDDFEKLYESLFQSSFSKKGKAGSKRRNYSIYDFIESYSNTPLGEINQFKKSSLDVIQDNPKLCIIENGLINPEIEYILNETSSLEDLQQKEWQQVIHVLRKAMHDELEKNRLGYKFLRLEVITENPFIEDLVFIGFKNKLHSFPILKQLLIDAYEPWNKDKAVLCNHCKYPMEEDENGNYKCLGDYICKNYDLKHLKDEEVKNTSVGQHWKLKKGFYIYTVLPTLFEKYVTGIISDATGYKTEMYWDIEESGDIVVTLPNGDLINIDCKAHRNAGKLFEKIENDYKANSINYYVLPRHYYTGTYKKKLNKLNREQGNRYLFFDEITILNELKKFK